ncbi:hypothetical protein PAPYR_10424 [Paratrimastix pyriformis]|uniref:Uncharacterized protein n=1 Tax=Paratrimastix pyriformis TaxID=342808 RepID=A0ABQ8U8L7_9EUKA|nr:hypothetical protein PAPYR_10424 [Paratrimastix pyriformis]
MATAYPPPTDLPISFTSTFLRVLQLQCQFAFLSSPSRRSSVIRSLMALLAVPASNLATFRSRGKPPRLFAFPRRRSRFLSARPPPRVPGCMVRCGPPSGPARRYHYHPPREAVSSSCLSEDSDSGCPHLYFLSGPLIISTWRAKKPEIYKVLSESGHSEVFLQSHEDPAGIMIYLPRHDFEKAGKVAGTILYECPLVFNQSKQYLLDDLGSRPRVVDFGPRHPADSDSPRVMRLRPARAAHESVGEPWLLSFRMKFSRIGPAVAALEKKGCLPAVTQNEKRKTWFSASFLLLRSPPKKDAQLESQCAWVAAPERAAFAGKSRLKWRGCLGE